MLRFDRLERSEWSWPAVVLFSYDISYDKCFSSSLGWYERCVREISISCATLALTMGRQIDKKSAFHMLHECISIPFGCAIITYELRGSYSKESCVSHHSLIRATVSQSLVMPRGWVCCKSLFVDSKARGQNMQSEWLEDPCGLGG